MKIQKRNFTWGSGWGGRGQVGFEQRIEVFVKIQKKLQWGVGGGVRGWVGSWGSSRGGGSGWM